MTKIYTRLKRTVRGRPFDPIVPCRLEMPKTFLQSRRKRALARELAARVASKDFDRLAALYEERLPQESTAKRLDAIQSLAAEHWDFRKGKLRYEVNFETVEPGESAIDLNAPEIKRVIEDVAMRFGMVAPSHASRDAYDGLIVPGGANESPYLRLRYALQQVGPNGLPVRYDWIALLGCDRLVKEEERQRVKFYAPHVKTEFDLMTGAADKLLTLTPLREATMRRVGYAFDRETQPHVRYYRDVSGTLVLVFNAPIPAGEVKANTGHTYDFLRAASGPRLRKGKHVLLSSTARHRVFQHIDAERLLCLTTGMSLETIGYGKSYAVDDSNPGAPVEQWPKELLQEIKSYVDSLAKLKRATSPGTRKKSVASRL